MRIRFQAHDAFPFQHSPCSGLAIRSLEQDLRQVFWLLEAKNRRRRPCTEAPKEPRLLAFPSRAVQSPVLLSPRRRARVQDAPDRLGQSRAPFREGGTWRCPA